MSRLIHRYKRSEQKRNTKIHRRMLIDSLSLFQKENISGLTLSLKNSKTNIRYQTWCGSHRGQRRVERQRNCKEINKSLDKNLSNSPKNGCGKQRTANWAVCYLQTQKWVRHAMPYSACCISLDSSTWLDLATGLLRGAQRKERSTGTTLQTPQG